MLPTCLHLVQYYLHILDNALFHIFSGPLFANVEGYAYLDLLVWGLSPLSFLFLRDKFKSFFSNQKRGVRDKTLKGIVALSIMIVTSYFFLNYSPMFNWNYFSRTFNIEVGYFIFDMLIRTFEVTLALLSYWWKSSTRNINRNNAKHIVSVST